SLGSVSLPPVVASVFACNHSSAAESAAQRQETALLQEAGTAATDAAPGSGVAPRRESGLCAVRLVVHLGQVGKRDSPAGVARDRCRQVEPQRLGPEADPVAPRSQ